MAYMHVFIYGAGDSLCSKASCAQSCEGAHFVDCSARGSFRRLFTSAHVHLVSGFSEMLMVYSVLGKMPNLRWDGLFQAILLCGSQS